MRNERDFDGARRAQPERSLVARRPRRASIPRRSTTSRSGCSAGPRSSTTSFPYSQYTRRQLRFGYAVGPYHARYREETLFFTTVRHAWRSSRRRSRSISASRGDRCRPSSNTRPFCLTSSRYRLQLEGDVNVRLARGLSLSIEGTTSRIRDQLSIPRRGVTRRKCCCACAGCAAATNTTAARAHLYLRVDLQHDRQSAVRAIDRSVDGPWVMVDGPIVASPSTTIRRVSTIDHGPLTDRTMDS